MRVIMSSLFSRGSCRVEIYPKQSGETIINNPKPLDKHRISLSHVPGPTAVQFCTLLKGLPTEIRLNIWSYLLANCTFHIDLLPGRLGSRICYGCDTTNIQCWAVGQETVNIRKCRDVFCTSIVPFLQTCRQIYYESIDLLYKTVTFEISDLGCLKYFVEGIRSESLALIPELHVHWQAYVGAIVVPYSFTSSHGTWEMFWRIVFAEFKGLRDLTIHLCDPRNPGPPTDEAFNLLMTRSDISGWTFRVDRDYAAHSVIRGRKKSSKMLLPTELVSDPAHSRNSGHDKP